MRAVFRVGLLAICACSSPSTSATSPKPPVITRAVAARAGDDAPAVPALRLPGDVRPARMALDLTIVPEETSLSGRVHVDAEVLRPTRVVWMNGTGLTVRRATIGGRAARVVTGGEDFVGLVADAPLAAGATTIDLEYEAPIDHDRSRGVYAEQEGSDWYAYTFFEAIDARRAFPCFDEPSFKIPWKVTLHVRAEHAARGNAEIVGETPEGGGMKRVELAETRPLPSYLVAFVVGPFEIVDDGVAGRARTPVRFIVPKGRAGELGWAKEVTPKVVAALEEYFDMDYPYGKLDVAVVPRYWGTMEHPGIVAMGQPLTLIKPEDATRDRKQHYADILAHELGHYWFGDLVTMAWWDGTWLNEALGTWMDVIITDTIEPGWRFAEVKLDHARSGMEVDELIAAKPIRQTVDSKQGIEASFDNAIVYDKGSAVLAMFEAWIGRERWQRFIRAYVRKFAWRNASADDFLGVMRDELGGEVAHAFATFLDQPGVPVIEHTVRCAGAPAIVLRQRRALPAGTTEPAARTWEVPVCVRTWAGGKATRTCALLTAAEGSIPLAACPSRVLVNDGASGYYRSAYTLPEAKALLAAAKKGAALASVERRSVVGDLVAAVIRGEIAIGDALALVRALARDRDDKVAIEGVHLTQLVDPRPLDDALYARSQRFAIKELGPLARRLGWRRKKGDRDERQRLRLAVVPRVARAGDKQLAKAARKLADGWLAGKRDLPDDTVAPVLAVAARKGDARFFDRLLETARKSADRREQSLVLRTLGAFEDPAQAKRALAVIDSGEFDLRDTSGIVFALLEGRTTREVSWAWLQERLAALVTRVRADEAARALTEIARSFCDRAHRDQVASVIVPRAEKIEGAANAVAQALEAVDQCIAAHERNLPAVRAFLARY